MLVEYADNRIIIMPGGGILKNNVALLIREIDVREVHFSARSTVHSTMTHQNPKLRLSSTSSDYIRQTTDANLISAIMQALSVS